MTKNPNNLLNKSIMTNLFMQYSKRLNLTDNFSLIEIKRYLAISPDTYILTFKIFDEGREKIYRGNASIKESRLKGFEIMGILETNGFKEGTYQGPHNFAFDPDYNLLIYENINGKILITILKNKNIIKDVKLSARWLSKLHKLDYPINLKKYEFNINTKDLAKHYPKLAEKMDQIKKENLEKIRYDRRMLIHGDYQPNNIIINQNKIHVYDLNDASCDNPTIDVANFLTQLRTMMMRFASISAYNKLRKLFLSEYKKSIKINDKMKNDLKIYEKLFYLQILASLSAAIEDKEKNKKDILNKIYKWYEEA